MFFRLFAKFSECIRLARPVRLKEKAAREMRRLSVRAVRGEDRLQISFVLDGDAGRGRVFNFDRLQSEELGKTLVRINANVAKVVNKKNRKKNRSPTEVSAASVESEGGLGAELYDEKKTKVDDKIANCDAWKEGAELVVCSTRYSVQVNPPSVRSVLLPDVVMVGFPIYPKIEAEFVDLSACTVTWYKEEKGDAGEVTSNSGSASDLTQELPKSQDEVTNRDWKVGTPVQPGEGLKLSTSEMTDVTSQASGGDVMLGGAAQMPSPSLTAKVAKKAKRKLNGSMSNLNWTEVHGDLVYTPTDADMGHRLRIALSPSDGRRLGDDVDAVSSDVVSGPGHCPFEKRHELTKGRTERGTFRIVSYNILADLYADSDFSRDHLYAYCPPYALQGDYRKQLVLKEISGYNADVMCLQEVDRRLFNHDLLPTLGLHGMSGRLKLKYGEVAEGEAIFWRTDKFVCVGESNLHLGEALQTDPAYKALFDKVCTNEGLKAKLLDRKTVLQTCTLRCVEDASRHVVVATTHLYFHPRAGHVRLVQTAICLQHLAALTAALHAEHGQRPAVVFCGDFNSTPHHGVYELITTGRLPANNADWFAEGRLELMQDLALSHGLRLASAGPTPPYTNFVAGFADCLDYVFISSDTLRTQRVVPLPSHPDVTAHTALPSPVFPSDHLALVCDVLWL